MQIGKITELCYYYNPHLCGPTRLQNNVQDIFRRIKRESNQRLSRKHRWLIVNFGFLARDTPCWQRTTRLRLSSNTAKQLRNRNKAAPDLHLTCPVDNYVDEESWDGVKRRRTRKLDLITNSCWHAPPTGMQILKKKKKKGRRPFASLLACARELYCCIYGLLVESEERARSDISGRNVAVHILLTRIIGIPFY